MSNQTTTKGASTKSFGGWSSFGPIDATEMKIFDAAVGSDHVIGNAVYTPETVATQLVAGTNYKFKCMVVPVDKVEPLQWQAIVEIFNPLQGKPHVVHVTPI